MNLTNDEKARLATELCGLEKVETGPEYLDDTPRDFFYTLKGDYYCGGPASFDPVNNGQHTLLVLEGLARRISWLDVFGLIAVDYMNKLNDFNYAEAVCVAGLEVLRKDKA